VHVDEPAGGEELPPVAHGAMGAAPASTPPLMSAPAEE
jgi:hypothetical protein